MKRSVGYGLVGVAVVAVAATTASLAGILPQTDGSSAADDRAALVASAQPAAGGTFHRSYSRLVQVLPNASLNGQVVSDSAVVGTVKSVGESAGFVQGPDSDSLDKPSARRTHFDDPLADWRTLRVTIDVDEVLGGSSVPTLAFDFPIMGNTQDGHDAAAVRRAMLEMGTVVVMSRANPERPGYLGIDRQLAYPPETFAVVGADGTLSFPLIKEGDRPAVDFMAGVDTLDELRAEAGKPAWTWTWPE